MKIHQLSVEAALASLNTSARGLDAAEAARRLREYGPNRVEAVPRTALPLRFLQELTRLLPLILWAAAALSFIADRYDPGQGMARLGYVIIATIVVSAVFSLWQEYRVEKTIAALRTLLPRQVKVLRDGTLLALPVDDLVPGDIVLLEQGDLIPADCRLIEAFGVRVNLATVTGESLPQARVADACAETETTDARNMLLAGTALVTGQAKAVVATTGMATEFGKIAHLAQAGAAVSPLRQEISHLSRTIVLLAVLIGALFFAIAWRIGVPFWEDLVFAIGLIVAMVPEGLLPTLTLALVLATQRMARRNVLIRHLPSVEALGSTTVICTDKTGTLTLNSMTVRHVFLGGIGEASADEARRYAASHRPFFLVAGLCHDLKESAQNGQRRLLGDPMEIALVELAHGVLPNEPASPRLDEIPFDADRMRLSTVYDTPDGPTLYCKGAPESVLPLCSTIWVGGKAIALSQEAREQIARAQEAMTARGLRVLALATRSLPADWSAARAEEELVFAGLAALEDPPRPEVPDAMRKCREAGVRVIMVTGDHPHTAEAIAREIGLVHSDAVKVLTGSQLRGLSDIQLRLALDAPEILFARVGADQKMRIVQALKEKGQIVAVTGDGVNDAPALKSAHIGIAMGINGTEVAKEAADMVLLDDNFASIVNAIEEGRAVFENIRKFLAYILTHNVAELIPYLGFVLFRIPLALTPMQILSIDMGADSLTALGLGAEKPDPLIMQRPPRPKNERLLNRSLALRAYLFLGLIEAAAAMAAFFFVLYGAGWRYGNHLAMNDPLYLQATTACLGAITVMQVVNVFLCRSSTRSVFATGLRGNPLILWGVALETGLILLIVYTPWGQAVFGTAPVAMSTWLFMLPLALAMILLEEMRKQFARRVFLQP